MTTYRIKTRLDHLLGNTLERHVAETNHVSDQTVAFRIKTRQDHLLGTRVTFQFKTLEHHAAKECHVSDQTVQVRFQD